MAFPVEQWTSIEVRGVIRFLQAKGNTPSEIHRELVAVYGDQVMSRKPVWVWCKAFNEGRFDLADEPRVGRPRSSTSDEDVIRVDGLIQEDRRRKVRELAVELELPKSVIHEIMYERLGYRKVSSRWVPKQFTITLRHTLQR